MNFLSPQMKKPAATQAKAVVLPVACAGTVPAALAVGKGPETILQASQVLSTYDVETNTDLNDLGLLTLPRVDCPPEPQASVEEVFNQAVQHYRKNRLVAAVGGSHLISEGLVRAALEQHNGLGVLHLGAHPHAQRGEAAGFDESGVMARIREKCPVSHIGIRSMTRAERNKIRLENVVFARDICLNGLNAAADVIEYLSDKVYVAIHLDVLDPACMPAVGRPEPGGLDWYTLNALIRRVSREKTIVGFDLTGLAPQAGSFPAHLLAAKLVLKTLVYSLHNSV